MANLTSQALVIGNLVGARLAAEIGWEESALCMFSLGMVHYLVFFVTLYQRLSSSNKFPAKLRSAFFFVLRCTKPHQFSLELYLGAFDTSSKILFFLSLCSGLKTSSSQEVYEEIQC